MNLTLKELAMKILKKLKFEQVVVDWVKINDQILKEDKKFIQTILEDIKLFKKIYLLLVYLLLLKLCLKILEE